MALTRPTAAQINSVIEVVTDPLSVLNNRGTTNNQDVGIIMNRNGGGVSNVALFWQESSQSIVAAYTSSNGSVNSNVTVTSYANITGAVISGNAASGGSITSNTLGYIGLPQVTAANVTLALTDAGKHYYSTSSANLTLTVPSNANVAFPIGSAIMIINKGTGNVLVSPQVEASMYLAGNSTSASRTVASWGLASLVKTETNVWFISGVGVY